MINIKSLGIQPYEHIWQQMKQFTQSRGPKTCDELWILEHEPVYTQGQAGKPEHILNPQGIPVVQTDRGGQVTYHGPGQLVAYVLMDIKRRNLGVRSLVALLEKNLISTLNFFNIHATTKCGAPGVYVDENKIASIGLRVKNGCTYHGIALNINMDLNPFLGINPCGFEKMKMAQMSDFCPDVSIEKVSKQFISDFKHLFEE